MRITRAITSAAAGAAVLLILSASQLRADEFNKMTYLTFSGPVQVPGVVLPAGDYMFKLADPDTSRRVIQVWDKEGTHLYTMLLSIPDSIPKPADDPVVLFREKPAGEPQAIKSWFYPGETTGYEFVYPKDQAMKIAAANHESVLAQSEPIKSDADLSTYSKSKYGRVNESGQFEGQNDNANASAANQNQNAAANQNASATTTAAPATTTADQSQGSRTNDRDQQTAAAVGSDRDQHNAPTTTTAPNTTTTAQNNNQSAPAAPAPSSATQPSANRTDAGINRNGAAQRQNTTTAQDRSNARTTTAGSQNGNRTVGTTGQLPKTASNAPLVQLMAGLTLMGALGLRQLRKRAAVSRS